MQREIDWRHWVAAGIVVLGLVVGGWQILNRPGEQPNVPAPAGANPRMQDAPDYPPGAGQPSAAPSGATVNAPAPGLPPGLAR